MINLGRNPSLQYLQQILIKPGVIKQKVGCDAQYFQQIINIQQHQVYYPQSPSVQLKYPSGSVSLCTDIYLTPLHALNDGFRSMNQVKWALIQVTPAETNPDKAAVINQMLKDNEYRTQLWIPPLTLSNTYVFAQFMLNNTLTDTHTLKFNKLAHILFASFQVILFSTTNT